MNRRALPVALLSMGIALASPAIGSARTIDVARSASVTLLGERPDDLAGYSVAAAGDVNGDGHDDVIVGAPRADPLVRQDAGSAYVVFGGGPRGTLSLGALGARGFRIDGAARAAGGPVGGASDLSGGPCLLRREAVGCFVDGAGDVNGDGLDDIVVMAPGADVVVFGKRDSAPVDVAALGAGGYVIHMDPTLDDASVRAAHRAGDVNGDGLDDLAVEVYLPFMEDGGSLAVVYGKADSAPVELPAAGRVDVGSMFGGEASGLPAQIAAAGDVNGDGLADLLVGASGAASDGAAGSGAVFVVYGGRSPGLLPDVLKHKRRLRGFEVSHPRGARGFGTSVARFGRGFVVGAPLDARGRLAGNGGAWIIASRRAAPIRLQVGTRTSGPAGILVDVPGDVDGDRRRDVLVTAYARRGHLAEVFLFSATGARTATYRGLRAGREALSPPSAHAAGDAGGSHRPDLIFGSPGASAAYILISR